MHPLYSLLNSVTPLPALQCRSTICCLNSGVYDFRFLAIVLNSFFYKGSLPPCCVSLFSFSFSFVGFNGRLHRFVIEIIWQKHQLFRHQKFRFNPRPGKLLCGHTGVFDKAHSRKGSAITSSR